MRLHALAVAALAIAQVHCAHRHASTRPPAEPSSAPVGAPGAPPQAGGPRALVVISDLHLGIGPGPGAWQAFEDFRWADDFEAFLRAIDDRFAFPVDLVVDGDMFELWQTADGDCPPREPSDLGCASADARRRLQTILAAHPRELAALRAFASHDDNRLVVVPGNHDAVLLYPEVEALLAERMAGARYAFAASGFWMTADGEVLVEHGHQVRKDANHVKEWPGFLDDGGKPRVRRTAGEDFVRAIYDGYEAKYPILDNITDEGTGAKLVVAKEGWGAAQGVVAIVKHVLLDSTWSQLGGWLGGPGSRNVAEWDLAAARARGTALWADVLPPDDPGRQVFGAGEAALDPQALSDDELRLLCDAAAAYRAEHPEDAGRVPGCVARGNETLGAGGDLEGQMLGQIVGMARARDRAYASYLDARRKAVTAPGAKPFSYYVLGHTHLAESFSPMPASSDWRPVVLNDGAWQRMVTPEELRQRANGKLDASILSLRPEDLPAAYDALVFAPGSEPRLVCWRKPPAGSEWKLSEARCR